MQSPAYLIACMLLLSLCCSFEYRRMRIGVDYGPRLIGLAYSDLFGQTHPIQTIKNTGDLIQISSLVLTKARGLGAVEVVVGVPSDFDGRYDHQVRNFNGQLCLNFSTVLSTLALHKFENKTKVFLFDEKYTTKEAKLKMQMDRKKGQPSSLFAFYALFAAMCSNCSMSQLIMSGSVYIGMLRWLEICVNVV